ncbi:ParB/RepB/Spo0J family partition protein [Methylotetracoccus oryzae]|uniref:ParB/RepB/Spo0J family partition protein n=1 Tax=Methylotetracoccus oryzae TaxID=1919059 RepID=UPI001118D66B|nr:ParB/RepB/Spo0J family partition protein [Methylotetracoccus oryzae]
MTTKKRGLGRGLDALLGPAETQPVAGETLRVVPVEALRASPYQPRKDFDPARLQELADSISAQGVVQPILVRASGTFDYEIIAGERRWRAAQLAGLRDIPVIIRDVPDQSAMAIALIENIQREDLNPLEEAEALRRLSEEFDLTHQQIADAVGRSRATVTNLLRLNELHPEVKLLLSAGSLEMGHARAILALPLEQQAPVAQRVASKQLTVRATETLVRRLLSAPPSQPAARRPDPDIAALMNRLGETFGAHVQIQQGRKGTGKLIINYASLEHLQGILDRLER